MERASLVEPALKSHVTSMLRECRKYKDDIMNIAVNLSLLAVLILLGYGILSYKANNRTPKRSAEQKENDQREFVMRALGKQKHELSAKGPISGLPGFTSDVRFSSS